MSKQKKSRKKTAQTDGEGRPPLASLEVCGLRGFASVATLRLAVPNGRPGSGLTILVGPNSGGKSTLLECFQLLQHAKVLDSDPIPTTWRNDKAKGSVSIRFADELGRTALLSNSGGPVRWQTNEIPYQRGGIYVVPSRRTIFELSFQHYESNRDSHAQSTQLRDSRRFQMQFGGRLVRMSLNRDAVNAVLGRMFVSPPDWRVEPAEGGNVHLRIYSETGGHPIDGSGDGTISVLFLADALYDSSPGDVIVIDEPELSLHPQVQRRVAAVLAEYAADRQIIYATHSTYFADWQFVLAGASIARVFPSNTGGQIAQLRSDTVQRVAKLAVDYRNPHVLGTDAREVFFLEDGLILVEGQEDVVGYRRIAQALEIDLPAQFYGWGVGGAGNMHCIASVVHDLGFHRVVGVLDADQESLAEKLSADFREFTFVVSPTADVRTKPAHKATPEKLGILDTDGSVRKHIEAEARALVDAVNRALH